MARFRTFLVLFFMVVLAIPAAARGEVVVVDPNNVTQALRDKGFDWLKDQAKGAAKDWVFDTGQSETMHAILVKARERADGDDNKQNGRCKGHIMGKASDILNNINTTWTVKTVARFEFDTFTKLAAMASGLGGAAAEGAAINWLIGQYVGAAKDQAQSAAFDRLRKAFFDEKKPEYELYETSGTNGGCSYTLRAVWDIVNGTYRVLIEGDCHCNTVGNRLLVNPTRIGKWWISFEGRLRPNVDKARGTVSWVPMQPRMDFDAECNCQRRKLREAFASAPQQTGTVPSTGTVVTEPPPTGPAFTPPPIPAQPAFADIPIPTVPRFCTESERMDFMRQVMEAAERANENAKLASVRILQLDTVINAYENAGRPVPPDVTAQMNQARADADRWQKVFDELIQLHRRVLAMKAEDCDQQETSVGSAGLNGRPCPQMAAPPLPADRTSAAILAYHNALRARYGSPPLRWNTVLQENARQWAQVMASTGLLKHSPPSSHPGERESIILGRHGTSSPMGMLKVWGDEERYVNRQKLMAGGNFEDLCNGDWTQCGHFFPMIWSRTTDVGCAFVEGAAFDALVCRYTPKSNIPGKPVLDPEVIKSVANCAAPGAMRAEDRWPR